MMREATDRDRPPNSGQHHALADGGLGGHADRQDRQVKPRQRLHQTEAGLLIIGERMARNRRTAPWAYPDRFGFGDQISDGQHQAAVADQHPVAGTLGPQRLRREGILRNDRAEAYDGVDRGLEIVGVIIGLGLVAGWNLPIAYRRHCRRSFPTAMLQRLAARGLGHAESGRAEFCNPSCRINMMACGLRASLISRPPRHHR